MVRRLLPVLLVLPILALLVGGCARIEHASLIGSENEKIHFYVFDHFIEAALSTDQEVVDGQNHVVTGFWLRPSGVKHYQFREDIIFEFEPSTGRIVTGMYTSSYYHVGDHPDRGERDRNRILGGSVWFPRDPGMPGNLHLELDRDWWRTTRFVEIHYRKWTNPSRFPTH